ncbi:hypothetical protein DDE18_14165 [Nocardioides gansuensis]|uniref:Flagellar protein FlgN n=1 Tax=Nocardioides gansuensis TaxID=2138300 RepID=A0A2T8F838_9ACTN|nr:hypothetical protein [Nocardioides gansuensis]PVG81863.1 hypothetical protein DDE18_14165 [Nocardioides gansuensis]
MTLIAYLAALEKAATQWEDQGEQLVGARTTLAEADSGVLGPRVSPVADDFLEAWRKELDRLVETAGKHGKALDDTAADLDYADQETVDRMQSLMQWSDRHVDPAGGY